MTRYRRDQFPPVPKSVRIVTLSHDAGERVDLLAAQQRHGCVLAKRPVAVWLAVAAVCLAALLAWSVLRTAGN